MDPAKRWIQVFFFIIELSSHWYCFRRKVETAFFLRWWREQDKETQELVWELVQQGQVQPPLLLLLLRPVLLHPVLPVWVHRRRLVNERRGGDPLLWGDWKPRSRPQASQRHLWTVWSAQGWMAGGWKGYKEPFGVFLSLKKLFSCSSKGHISIATLSPGWSFRAQQRAGVSLFRSRIWRTLLCQARLARQGDADNNNINNKDRDKEQQFWPINGNLQQQ